MTGKICCLALLFSLFFSSVFAEEIVLNMDGYDALVTRDGEIIVAPDRYHAIYELGGGYLAFGMEQEAENGFQKLYFALGNSDGNILTETEYTHLEYADGIILFEKDGLYGAMNEKAEVIVPCEYTWLQKCEEGFLALKSDTWDTAPDNVYILDSEGNESKSSISVLDMGKTSSEGMIAALSADSYTYGYLNAKGEWQIEPSFTYAGEFSDGIARVSLGSGLGVINTKGEWAIKPEYDALENTGEILIGTKYSKGVTLIARDTLQVIAEFSGKEVYAHGLGGYIAVYMPDSALVVSDTGENIFAAPGNAKITYAGAGVIVETEGESALFSFNGVQLSVLYDQIIPAGVHSGRELFIIADLEYGGELTAQYGLMDGEGTLICPCEYRLLYPLGEERFFAQGGGYTGIIDTSGMWIARFGGDS